jgi:hypothetical protein
LQLLGALLLDLGPTYLAARGIKAAQSTIII